MNKANAVTLASETLSAQTDPRLLLAFYGTAGNGTTEYDLSGNNNDATYTAGSSWTSADNIFKGQVMALDFDGTDDYLTVADDDSLSFSGEAVSWSGWIEVINNADLQVIVSKYDQTTGSELREWIIYLDASEKLVLQLYDESANVSCDRTTDSAVAVGWHHIAVTYDGGDGATAMDGCNIYIDGLLVASTATNDGSFVSTENLATDVLVGSLTAAGGSPSFFFLGDMAQLTITGEELTAAQVWAEFLKGSGRTNEYDNIS